MALLETWELLSSEETGYGSKTPLILFIVPDLWHIFSSFRWVNLGVGLQFVIFALVWAGFFDDFD